MVAFCFFVIQCQLNESARPHLTQVRPGVKVNGRAYLSIYSIFWNLNL